MPRTCYIASPWVPAGGHWLVNCLLELGIKVHTYGGQGHVKDWVVRGGKHYVGEYRRFAQYIPAFSDNEYFEFRPDVTVVWGHIFPYAHLRRSLVAVFTRDPRDALFLQYKREKDFHGLNAYEDWLRWPFHQSLLDQIDNWDVFHRLWREHPGARFFRFEDYRRDEQQVLEGVLHHLGISAEPRRIAHALERSSYERYLRNQGREIPRDVRAFDFWRERRGEEYAIGEIECCAGDSMHSLGYELTHASPGSVVPDVLPHMFLNPFFHELRIPGEVARADLRRNPYVLKTIAFCKLFLGGRAGRLSQQYTDLHTYRELCSNLASYLANCRKFGVVQ